MKHIVEWHIDPNKRVRCKVKEGAIIGSLNCYRCEHCKGMQPRDEVNYSRISTYSYWIDCERIGDALGVNKTENQ